MTANDTFTSNVLKLNEYSAEVCHNHTVCRCWNGLVLLSGEMARTCRSNGLKGAELIRNSSTYTVQSITLDINVKLPNSLTSDVKNSPRDTRLNQPRAVHSHLRYITTLYSYWRYSPLYIYQGGDELTISSFLSEETDSFWRYIKPGTTGDFIKLIRDNCLTLAIYHEVNHDSRQCEWW